MIGDGFKVCAEIAVMAADSGCIPVNQEIISMEVILGVQILL